MAQNWPRQKSSYAANRHCRRSSKVRSSKNNAAPPKITAIATGRFRLPRSGSSAEFSNFNQDGGGRIQFTVHCLVRFQRFCRTRVTYFRVTPATNPQVPRGDSISVPLLPQEVPRRAPPAASLAEHSFLPRAFAPLKYGVNCTGSSGGSCELASLLITSSTTGATNSPLSTATVVAAANSSSSSRDAVCLSGAAKANEGLQRPKLWFPTNKVRSEGRRRARAGRPPRSPHL